MALYEKALGVPAPKVTVNTSTSNPLAQPQNRTVGELFDFEINPADLQDGDIFVFDATTVVNSETGEVLNKFVRKAASTPVITVDESNLQSAAPTVASDSVAGFAVGSVWYRDNTAGGTIDLYVASDVTGGAAVWPLVMTISKSGVTVI